MNEVIEHGGKVICQAADGKTSLNVEQEDETVLLTLNRVAGLFDQGTSFLSLIFPVVRESMVCPSKKCFTY